MDKWIVEAVYRYFNGESAKEALENARESGGIICQEGQKTQEENQREKGYILNQM
jgi:hypothetical protein